MENKFCVIMAGGVGSRFWPFSRNEKPKQFLDFFGTGRTLIQMTYDRFAKLIPASNFLIVTNIIYKELILEQLPALQPDQVLCEPARRNTAPCIAYAMHRIKSITEEAQVIVAPADHLILKENDFLDTINTGLDYISKNGCLLTIGISPSRPETGYGYIQIETGEGDIHKVKTFTEKPTLEVAKVFCSTGEFFWNSGIFMWSLSNINREFEAHLPEIHQKFSSGIGKYNTPNEQSFIDSIYETCPSISIDYGIMEKATQVSVICADFGWSDLGTWGSLYELSEKDASKNATLKGEALYYQSNENIVATPKGKLAVIQGLEGYIVADTENVLLICKQEEEQNIKQYVIDATLKYKDKYN